MAYANTGAAIRSDINTIVTQAANADKQFIADKVLPVYTSNTKTGIYPVLKIAKGELLGALTGTERAQGGSYNEIVRAYESDTFDCLDRGLQERIDDAFAQDFSRFTDVEVSTAALLLRNIKAAAEVRAAAALFNSSTFTTTSATVDILEANLATVDVPKDIDNAIERLALKGQTANTLVVNQRIWNRFKRSTKLQSYLYGNLPSGVQRTVKPEDLGSEFGLNIVIAAASKNSAKKNATASLSFIWSDAYFWIGNVQGGDFTAGGAGRTIVWTQDSDLYTTETWRDEDRRSDMLRVRQHCVEKIIDSTAGELIATGA